MTFAPHKTALTRNLTKLIIDSNFAIWYIGDMEIKQGIMTMVVMAGKTVKQLSAELGVSGTTIHNRLTSGSIKVDSLTNIADKCGFDVMLVQRPSHQTRGVGQVKIRLDTFWTVGEQMRIENRIYALALQQDKITDADKAALWEYVGDVNNQKIQKYYGLNKENAAPYTVNEAIEEPKVDIKILTGNLKYKEMTPEPGREPNIISVTSNVKALKGKKD